MTKYEMFDFVEWVGNNYTKLHGCWCPLYSNQSLEESWRTTEQIYEKYKLYCKMHKSLKNNMKNKLFRATLKPIPENELSYLNQLTDLSAKIMIARGRIERESEIDSYEAKGLCRALEILDEELNK